jgi:hypothetical protein
MTFSALRWLTVIMCLEVGPRFSNGKPAAL